MDLKEYRCELCNKLLCKGSLSDKADILEIKCRGCHNICHFEGDAASVIKLRSDLMREG